MVGRARASGRTRLLMRVRLDGGQHLQPPSVLARGVVARECGKVDEVAAAAQARAQAEERERRQVRAPHG